MEICATHFLQIFFQILSLKLGAIGFKGKKMKIKEGRGRR
jgi:hypothetical protein